ncbi:sigma factor-like helix-turn-helix DNA-binding protein [Streptomyces sp. NPDC013457]|uniref:sigma factor-like helix-turn-helix DNA-binding protein n=1 Tax=Streptomyces sp. NPDC013457 TaxID=3364866 RepID=UPI0036F80EB6
MNRSIPSPKERRRLREAKGLSEDQVAEAMGVTRATVRSWETGRTSPRGRKQEAYVKLIGAYDEQHTPSDPPPAAPNAHTRPRAATKRAAKPPKGPAAAALGIGGGQKAPRAVRAGSPDTQQPLERLKPVETPPLPPHPPAEQLLEAPAPEAFEAPEASEAPEALVAPEASEAPEAFVAPEASESREALVAPEASEAPEALVAPEAPMAPMAPAVPSLTPEEAFDALYAHAAPGLLHQTYLLTGRRRLSREAVERAFQQAWQRWPEVAVDRDPVGWVRAAAYEYALSPWHRLRRAHKHPDAPPTEPARRELLGALLELPPPYRRTVLLYDGLGLDLPDTAAETEASTPAAANRVMHARTAIGERVPALADPDALQRTLGALVAETPTATLAEARSVRDGSERSSRMWTRAVVGVTAALIAVTALTAATAPTQYLPLIHPGERVNGVPVRGGSPKLTPEDVRLHDRLRSQPHNGPERLIPDPH